MAKGAKKDSFKEKLRALLDEDDDDQDDTDDSEDQIILRGPAARKLLGLLDDDTTSKSKTDEDEDDEDEPEPEPKPQRTHSRYFKEQ